MRMPRISQITCSQKLKQKMGPNGVTKPTSPPKNIAATIRVPRSRARFVLMVISAKPQTIAAYAMPITKGALAGLMKGFAGSRTAQITMPLAGG